MLAAGVGRALDRMPDSPVTWCPTVCGRDRSPGWRSAGGVTPPSASGRGRAGAVGDVVASDRFRTGPGSVLAGNGGEHGVADGPGQAVSPELPVEAGAAARQDSAEVGDQRVVRHAGGEAGDHRVRAAAEFGCEVQWQFGAVQVQGVPEIVGVRLDALLEAGLPDQFLRRADEPVEPLWQRVGLDVAPGDAAEPGLSSRASAGTATGRRSKSAAVTPGCTATPNGTRAAGSRSRSRRVSPVIAQPRYRSARPLARWAPLGAGSSRARVRARPVRR